jgi:hypothetical protein
MDGNVGERNTLPSASKLAGPTAAASCQQSTARNALLKSPSSSLKSQKESPAHRTIRLPPGAESLSFFRVTSTFYSVRRRAAINHDQSLNTYSAANETFFHTGDSAASLRIWMQSSAAPVPASRNLPEHAAAVAQC